MVHIYIMEYYSAIKRNEIESVVVMWMNLEFVIQREVHQKETNKHTNLERNTHPSVHSSIIYNYQVMEATSIPINRRMDKDAVYTDNGILKSQKRMKFFHLHLEGTKLNEISQTEKDK